MFACKWRLENAGEEYKQRVLRVAFTTAQRDLSHLRILQQQWMRSLGGGTPTFFVMCRDTAKFWSERSTSLLEGEVTYHTTSHVILRLDCPKDLSYGFTILSSTGSVGSALSIQSREKVLDAFDARVSHTYSPCLS
jgi:hypothetical protein